MEECRNVYIGIVIYYKITTNNPSNVEEHMKLMILECDYDLSCDVKTKFYIKTELAGLED
jgi:hypothetical protein